MIPKCPGAFLLRKAGHLGSFDLSGDILVIVMLPRDSGNCDTIHVGNVSKGIISKMLGIDVFQDSPYGEILEGVGRVGGL